MDSPRRPAGQTGGAGGLCAVEIRRYCLWFVVRVLGALVCGGAANFNETVRRNDLRVVLCNDHARRRFHQVCIGLGKDKAAGSIAEQGLHWYKPLYALERDIKDLSTVDKYEQRQAQSVSHWAQFLA
jgi:hypothetical protein